MAQALGVPGILKLILIFIILIVAVIGLIAFYLILANYHLVSAVILGVFGLLLVALIGFASPKTLDEHPILLACIVLFLFLLGFISDRISQLAMLNLGGSIGVTVGAMQVGPGGYVSMVVMTPTMLGVVILVAVVFLLIALVAKVKAKRR